MATKKLIEVALPLDKINEACVREKSIRHGHPSTLHLWWARRPLAAARAVIWASLIDDPSAHLSGFLQKMIKIKNVNVCLAFLNSLFYGKILTMRNYLIWRKKKSLNTLEVYSLNSLIHLQEVEQFLWKLKDLD